LVKRTGTALLALHGVGSSGAARLLVEVGEITRFPSKGPFAFWAGTATVGTSSGDNVRHRLWRGGNRQNNKTLHMMAVVQWHPATEGRRYYDRKIAAGKTPDEALRCLKPRLSGMVYKTMLDDLVDEQGDEPGRTPGRDTHIQRGRLTVLRLRGLVRRHQQLPMPATIPANS
jgi:transposase